MVSKFQQDIYNDYLCCSRQGKPWTPRKQWDNLDESTATTLRTLEIFFRKFTHIKPSTFIRASFYYNPDTHLPLSFFLTRPAIKNYTTYINEQKQRNPELQIDEIRESLHFIGMFCLKHKIPVTSYLKHTEENAFLPSWLTHFKQDKINPYSLMELGIESKIDYKILTEEVREMLSNDVIEQLATYKYRYQQSPTTKQFVKQSTNKLINFVNTALTSGINKKHN